MAIMEEKGRKVNLLGYEYRLKMSLTALDRIDKEIVSVDDLMLNFRTVPQVLKILIEESRKTDPEAPDLTLEQLNDGLDVSDFKECQKIILEMLNPPALEEDSKNG